MANTYDIGDVVTLTETFTVSGVATDPTTITLTVKPYGVAATSYTYALSQITKSGTGIYTKDISATSAGIWWYRWAGTGTCATAREGYFYVRTQQTA